jgi:hypothetical protein
LLIFPTGRCRHSSAMPPCRETMSIPLSLSTLPWSYS